jgi:hypothetical protein
MAILTTLDGRQITFSPSTVTVITDYDVFTHAAVTCVYGIRKAMVMTAEAAPALMERLDIQSKVATLTRPTGRAIWIVADAVTTVSEPASNSFTEGVRSVIEIGSIRMGVAESLDEATNKINANRQKLLWSLRNTADYSGAAIAQDHRAAVVGIAIWQRHRKRGMISQDACDLYIGVLHHDASGHYLMRNEHWPGIAPTFVTEKTKLLFFHLSQSSYMLANWQKQ